MDMRVMTIMKPHLFSDTPTGVTFMRLLSLIPNIWRLTWNENEIESIFISTMSIYIWFQFAGTLCYNDYSNRNVRKRTLGHVRPEKTQISLRIHEVWLESSLSSRRNFASLAIQNASSEDSDQTARMRSLIWIFTGRTSSKVRFMTFRLIHTQFLVWLLFLLFTKRFLRAADFVQVDICFVGQLFITNGEINRITETAVKYSLWKLGNTWTCSLYGKCKKEFVMQATHSRTWMAWTSLGPWTFVLDMGS